VANYTMRADGTAANLAAALDGDPTVASECLSLAGYNSYGAGASPGDHFQLADDGGDYRGTLSVVEAGTFGNEYVYEAYSGDTPILNGSDLIVTWSDEGSDIWSAAVTTEPQQVWMDGTFGDRQEDLVSCVNEYDWFWESNVLKVFAASDPDTRYTSPGVEAGARNTCLSTKSYVIIDGLTFSKSNAINIYSYRTSYLTVRNCTSEWAWEHGARFSTDVAASNLLVEDCTFSYCGANGIAGLVTESGTFDDVVVRRNKCNENGRHQYKQPVWTSTHGFSGAMKFFGTFVPVGGWRFYENLCYDNGPAAVTYNESSRGQGIWMDAVDGASDDPVQIYHNLIYDTHGCGVFIELCSYNDVHNNVIYNCATGSNIDNHWASGGIRVDTRLNFVIDNVNVYNNTIAGCWIGIHATAYNMGSCEFNDCNFKNNICSGNDIELRVSDGADNDTYGSGNVYKNNCLGAEAADFISWGGSTYSTYDAWLAASSQTDNNIESDPSFTDAGSDDYTLGAASPCIGAGENLGSPYDAALLPASSWTAAVVTGSQDDY